MNYQTLCCRKNNGYGYQIKFTRLPCMADVERTAHNEL